MRGGGGEHLQHEEDACKIATDYSHCTQNQIRAAVAICGGGREVKGLHEMKRGDK